MKSNIRYYLKEASGNVFSHGFMSFAAIGITIACLLIMGTFTLVAYNMGVNLEDLQRENAIVAFIDETADQETVAKAGDAIASIDGITKVEFIARETARDEYIAKYDENELYGNLSANVFRHRYVIRIDDQEHMGGIKAAIDQVPGVAWTRADEAITSGFIAIKNIAQFISIAMIAVLLVVSLFIISNTIKLTTFDRREEIAIMKMVGASNSFIRGPFIYEGLFFGAMSAIIAFGMQWGIYEVVRHGITSSDSFQLLRVVKFTSIWYYVAGSFAVAGVLIGVGGSLVAIRKFLRV